MRGSEFAGRKAWWQGLRRKVCRKALQQANLRRQDKKDAPKAGDGKSNAGTLKYLGSASDLAITSAGLLLNIKMCKDASGSLTSYVQGVSVEG